MINDSDTDRWSRRLGYRGNFEIYKNIGITKIEMQNYGETLLMEKDTHPPPKIRVGEEN